MVYIMKISTSKLFKRKEMPIMENEKTQLTEKGEVLSMKDKIVELRKSVEKIAQEHTQEEEKLKKSFKSASEEIISNIKGERKKLVKKQEETEAELKRIRIKIELKKQQYNKSIQEANEEKTKEIEKELLEMTGQENVLALRQETFSKIVGCDNESTRKSFNELYNLYFDTKKEEGKIHAHYKEILEELENLKKTLEKEIEEIKHINIIYHMDASNGGANSDYAKYDVVKAYEMIYGELKQPDLHTFWDVGEKMRVIYKAMAKRQG